MREPWLVILVGTVAILTASLASSIELKKMHNWDSNFDEMNRDAGALPRENP